MNCSQCGSDNTRKYSIIYEAGTSRGKSECIGGEDIYEVKHFSQTPLAERCSPPKESKIGTLFIIFSLIFSVWLGYKIGNLIGGFWWGVGAFFIVLIAVQLLRESILEKSKKMNEYRQKYRVWEKSWLCMKCGNGFLPE